MTLKKCFVTILYCCSCVVAFSQSTEVKKFLGEVSGIIKNNSIVTAEIDWKSYDSNIALLSKNIYAIDSCKPVLDYIISTLRKKGDLHSFFVYPSVVKELHSEVSQTQYVQARLIDTDIGYIKVPAIASFNTQVNDGFRDTIQQLIKKLDTENTITGWIVDLRHNTGGNMWPMIAGLNALIKDGVAGYWVSPKNKKSKWYSSGRSMIGTGKFYKIKKLSSPIAVLINSFTASSGEMTAISFLGLSNVKTFGQPSAGYTTSNTTFPLSNGTILQLATLYVADRRKKIYKDKIIPDMLINPGSKNPDESLEAAKNWLQQ